MKMLFKMSFNGVDFFFIVILMIAIILGSWVNEKQLENTPDIISIDFEIIEAVDSYIENNEVVIIYKAYETKTENMYYITSNNTILTDYTEDVEEK